jgi:hypothetical protein
VSNDRNVLIGVLEELDSFDSRFKDEDIELGFLVA